VILAWVQSWNILKSSWNCEVCQNFFTKTCLTNNYFSRDPHCVILTWEQSWNIFEKFMKLWSQSCWQLRLAIHLASFALMSRQWWPKCNSFMTVTVSVFVPVLNEFIGSFVFWFTCALTKPTMDQCSHPNGKHLI